MPNEWRGGRKVFLMGEHLVKPNFINPNLTVRLFKHTHLKHILENNILLSTVVVGIVVVQE